MKIILNWVLISVSVFVTTKIISGIIVDPIWVALVVGACLTLFNMFIKPIIKVLTLPLNILTLGLFSLVINSILFWYLGTFIKGFEVSTLVAAFVGAIVVSVINWLFSKVFRVVD
ncbi:MAG TPA: phage holin family protein [Candidatus Paceibacterota bacterium]|jgi:putative membrane protein|nr:phage holin family protein [Candidatus Paceibacterota bacterium]HOX90893.1 phage holin family protein [Candidatus Paceibacterota bacterium]HPC12597.1 phage holin family protein [Candidatus Paceibacterota bacterium]HQC46079.1 phage holin family protein [Candidatus Paceibacterota bacterium]HQM18849.1 phage holin family protein [Candidatus Paceibacterota bacterium]